MARADRFGTARARRRLGIYVGPVLFVLLSVNCDAVEVRTGPGRDREVVAPESIAPGEKVEIAGTGYHNGDCSSLGCASCSRPATRAKNVDITLRQGDKSWTLATVDANGEYTIKAEVTAPADVAPGAAVITAGGAEAEVTVVQP